MLNLVILASIFVQIYSREYKNIMARVVEGKNARQKNWYFMVSMFTQSQNHSSSTNFLFKANCGGVIVNKWHILTAAHCLYEKIPENVIFSAGSTRIERVLRFKDKNKLRLDQERTYKLVESLILHPNFVKAKAENDIALVRVTEAFIFDSEKIGPIPLETIDQVPKGRISFDGY